MGHIQPVELKARLAENRALVMLDVREAWEHERAGIAKSIHIPMGEVPARATELDSEAELVVICHHGVRSMQVARFLERQGFASVFNLTGGIDAWARAVDPSMPLY